jgi:N6-adenosine-specific RNA methylase IME4
VKYRTIVADPPWPITGFPKWGWQGGKNPCPYPVMSIPDIKSLPVREIADNLDGDAFLYLWAVDQFLEEAFGVARAWGFHHAATLTWCKPPRPKGLGGVFPSNVEHILFCRRPKVVSRPDVLRVTTHLADAAERSGISRAQLDAAMGTSDMAGWWLSRIEYRCACPSIEQYEAIKRLVGADDQYGDLVREINARKGTKPFEPFERVTGRWFTWPRGKHSQKPEHFYDLVEQVSPPPYVELFARRHRLGWDTWGLEAANTAAFYPEALESG